MPQPASSVSTAFPLIEGKDLDDLIADIKANGLIEPITLKEGMILDGRNRYLACQKAGHTFTDRDFVELPVRHDPLAFVVAKNIQRRHLTADQKREIIRQLIANNPSASSRQIASIAHTSHHTLEAVRKGTGQSAQLRTGADGKTRRAPRLRRGGTSEKRLREQLNRFTQKWEAFNGYQKRSFIKSIRTR